MKPAADGMRIALDKLSISSPSAPIVSGLDGALVSSNEYSPFGRRLVF